MPTIRFYPSGDDGPVRKYLETLREDPRRKDAWAKLMIDLTVLRSEGVRSGQITIKKVVGIKGSVWELVRPFEGMAYRIYFCLQKGEIWLIHWAEKKSQKIPANGIILIGKRAKEVFRK